MLKGLLLSLGVAAGGIRGGLGVGLRNLGQLALQTDLAAFERELTSGFPTNFTECMPEVHDYQSCDGFNKMAEETVSCVADVLGLEGDSYEIYLNNYCVLMTKYELLLPEGCEVSICEGKNVGETETPDGLGFSIGNCSIPIDGNFSSCDDVNQLVDSLLDCLENMTDISEEEWGQYADNFCSTFEEFADMFPQSCPIDFCLTTGSNETSTETNSTDYFLEDSNSTETEGYNTTETENPDNIDLDCNLPNDLDVTSCTDVNAAFSSLYSCYESFDLNSTMLEAYREALCSDIDQYEFPNLQANCTIQVCSNSTTTY